MVHGCVGLRACGTRPETDAPRPAEEEEELAEHLEMWQDKMMMFQAHEEECKLAPLFKINALRMLMTGKAKEYSVLWEADRDTTDAAQS